MIKWGDVFNEVTYSISSHAEIRWEERKAVKHSGDRTLAEVLVTCEVVGENEGHRYLSDGYYYFPCARNNPNEYIVKTVLTKGHVPDLDHMLRGA